MFLFDESGAVESVAAGAGLVEGERLDRFTPFEEIALAGGGGKVPSMLTGLPQPLHLMLTTRP